MSKCSREGKRKRSRSIGLMILASLSRVTNYSSFCLQSFLERFIFSHEFLKSILATASIKNALAHNWGISPLRGC